MKRCTICKQHKELESFNKKSNSKDGLQPACRACSHEKFKKYYEANKEKQLRVVKDRNARYVKDRREWLFNYFQQHPCVDCGYSDFRALEFDHVDSDKITGVAAMIRNAWSFKKIEQEISKCEVRCRNCHQIKTFERMGNTWHQDYI